MKPWLIIAYWWLRGPLDAISWHNHLSTDPACVHYHAPRPGSWLDRASRGLECEPCMVRRAFAEPVRCVKCGGPDGVHDPACVVHPNHTNQPNRSE